MSDKNKESQDGQNRGMNIQSASRAPGPARRRICAAEVTSLPTQASLDERRDKMPPDYRIILMPLFASMSPVCEGVFLTGIGGMTKENFEKNNITCVVNATYEAPSLKIAGIESIRIAVDDSVDDDLTPYMDFAADKMNDIVQKGGRTVVHCVAGVSRSAALTIGYLIKYKRMSLHAAFNHVHERRPVIRPNNAFFKQLIDYERKHLGSNSVQMVTVEKNGYRVTIPDFFEKEHPKFVLLEVLKAKNKAQSKI